MTTEEQRNLKVAAQYEELYNTDVERFVRECSTADCEVYAMGIVTIRGHEQFIKAEQRRSGGCVSIASMLRDLSSPSKPYCSTPIEDQSGRYRSARSSPAVTAKLLRTGPMPIIKTGRVSKRYTDRGLLSHF